MTDQEIRSRFQGAGDFIARELNCRGITLYAYAIDGLVSGADMSEFVLQPIARNLTGDTVQTLYQAARNGQVYNSVADVCADVDTVVSKLVNGFCVVLFPEAGAIAFEVKTGVSRGPSAPEVENTIKGPKDAFVETIRVNTSLLRRHLRTPDLRIWGTTVGRRSLTNVAVVWIEGITNRQLVERMQRRLNSIDIDGLVSPAAVEEYITGSRLTAFPLLQYTERPDRFAQGLLDGRVGLIVDGLPLAYLAPADLGYLMESSEDRSRDLTRKSGDKISSIRPNLREKVANKVAGMVDLVARIVADDNDRVLSFKTSEVIFGGGRLTVHNKEIPLDYEAFCEVYEEANQRAAGAMKHGGNTPATPAPETADSGEQRPSRRGRKPKAEEAPAPDPEAVDDPNGTFTPGGGEVDDSAPVEQTEPDTSTLPKCPDGDRIFQQNRDNPEIPLCPSIDAAHCCHKEGGPDACPLWDRPKAEEPAPKIDVNPTRRTRKKRDA